MRHVLLILVFLTIPGYEPVCASFACEVSGGCTYYLLKENYSVAGAGNADGSTITRTDYSSTGDFAGAAGSGIDVDYNNDGDVDSDDFNAFDACFTGPNVSQDNPSCADKKLDGDSDVDQADFAIFQRCYSGADNPAAPECTGSATPPSGTFTLHGRPVDVLADGHALLYVRARYYDLTNGRWLQRDPVGYVDSVNAYEAYQSNPLSFTDPAGTEIWATAQRYKSVLNGVPAWAVDYRLNKNGLDLGIGGLVYPGAVDSQMVGTEYYPFTQDLRKLARYDTLIETTRELVQEGQILERDIAAYSKAIKVSGTAVVALPVAAIAEPVAEGQVQRGVARGGDRVSGIGKTTGLLVRQRQGQAECF